MTRLPPVDHAQAKPGTSRRRKKRTSGSSPLPPVGSKPRKPPPRKGARFAQIALWIVALLVVLCGAVFLVYFPRTRGPGSGRDVELVVPGDESAEALAARLEAAGLTDRPSLFAFYLRATGGTSRIVRGAHLVTDDLSPKELMDLLERSAAAGRAKVTIPEGWTRFDIARRLQTLHVCTLRAFLDRTTDAALLADLHVEGASAEGFLFPATYELPMDSDPADVVRRLKAEFDRRYAALEDRNQPGLLDLTRTLGWGTREIVTLASMVEKEAGVDEDRPVIASVFFNRLRDPAFTPKILQCDPTAGYGCLVAPEKAPSCASYTGKITHDMVADAANPYNTYKHEGLPPGPIANPGAKSIEAVMSPASTRYFYFVAKGDGRSTFSETYGAHVEAVHPTAKTP